MANQLPGVEVSFSRTSDISLTAPNNRLLIAALVAPGAPTTIGTPFLATSAAQVDAQAGGGWTHASRLYRASKAQTSDAETWILPLADPAGTPHAYTHQHRDVRQTQWSFFRLLTGLPAPMS